MTTHVPYMNTRQDAAFRFLGLPTLMRSTAESTNGTFGLMEHWDMPVGFASPYHTHRREDESFYVLEGEIAFLCDGKWLRASTGAFCPAATCWVMKASSRQLAASRVKT